MAPVGSALATPGATDPSAITQPTDAQTQAFRSELLTKQARLDQLKAELDQLDTQLELATEDYNAAVQSLTDEKDKLSAARSDLGAAQDAYDEQAKLLDERVEAIYRDGQGSTTSILLGSSSITDFFKRLRFITTISEADAQLAAELGAQRDQVASTELELEKAELQARATEFSLKARKSEIEYRIAEREKMLAAAQKDLAASLDTEAKQRVASELGIWKSIVSGASDLGITIEPGSPVETALSYHGIPYVWGGATPSGFDCSGLTMYVYKQHGVTLPHHAASQILLGEKVALSEIQPGDLVFFGSPVHHVGMYIGGGYFVHAPKTGDFVKVSRLADRGDLAGIRRYSGWRYRVGPPLGVSGPSVPSGLTSSGNN